LLDQVRIDNCDAEKGIETNFVSLLSLEVVDGVDDVADMSDEEIGRMASWSEVEDHIDRQSDGDSLQVRVAAEGRRLPRVAGLSALDKASDAVALWIVVIHERQPLGENVVVGMLDELKDEARIGAESFGEHRSVFVQAVHGDVVIDE
jgi:hypothetical protein